MFCPNCGRKAEENTKYCSNCGALLKTKPDSNGIPKPNRPTNVSNSSVNPKQEKPKKKTGLIIAIVLVVVIPVIICLAGGTIVALSENWAPPPETFADVVTREFTVDSGGFDVTTQDDYTFDYDIDDTEAEVNNGKTKIKEFSFDSEYGNIMYMYTYADGSLYNWSDGDIISLSGSMLLDKSMNNNDIIPGYVDGFVDSLESIETIGSDDVTVNITDNGDYISASFTFSNLAGNDNRNYVNAVAEFFGVSTVGGVLKDADLSECLENNDYTVKEY